jgi:hypothetical protein
MHISLCYNVEGRERPHTTGGTTLGGRPIRLSNLYLSDAHVYSSSKYPIHPKLST